MSNNTSSKKTQSSPWSDSFFESLRDAGSSITSGVKTGLTNDVGRGIGKGVGQGFNSFVNGFSGENLDRQERPLASERKDRPAQTYEQRKKVLETVLFSHADKRKEMALKQEMEAVRAELAAIVQEIRSLGQEVKETEKAVAEHIVDPGEYHITMFERLRQVLKLLRKQLADSKTWLQTSNSRKRAKGYWGMAKKHGTSFSLNNERTVATQSG